MPSTKPRMTVRADQEIINKITYIAEQNERSFNQEMVYLMKKRIKDYEQKNGNISIGDISINSNNGNISIGSNNNIDIG